MHSTQIYSRYMYMHICAACVCVCARIAALRCMQHVDNNNKKNMQKNKKNQLLQMNSSVVPQKMSTSDKAANKAAGPCCKQHNQPPAPPAFPFPALAPCRTELESDVCSPSARGALSWTELGWTAWTAGEEERRREERRWVRGTTWWIPQVFSKTLTLFGVCRGRGRGLCTFYNEINLWTSCSSKRDSSISIYRLFFRL